MQLSRSAQTVWPKMVCQLPRQVVLDTFTKGANRAIKLAQLDAVQAKEEIGKLHGTSEVIEAFLKRHLSDEEELAVPIILHHRLRG